MIEFFMRLSLVTLFCVLSDVLLLRHEDQELPVSDNQLSQLAEDICLYYFNPIEQERCIRNLRNRNADTVLPPSEIQIRCRSRFSVTFTITPSEFMQLVVVEPTNDSTPIDYAVIYPNESSSTIESMSYNTSIWSTKMTPDGIMGWHRGPVVPYFEDPNENRTYVIDMLVPYNYKEGEKKLRGLFKWNSSDEMDSCFEIRNYCNKRISGDYFTENLSPANKLSIEVDGIIKNDVCTFSIKGKYGTTTFNYTTPCDHSVECMPLPEIPTNLTVSAEISPDQGWDVVVQWNRPQLDPVTYNVTLYLDEDIITRTLPGNATQVLFPSITYEGIYEVTVSAIVGPRASLSSYRNYLPAAPMQPSSIGIAVSSVWTATIMCAAVLSSFILWRCRRDRRNTDITSLKFPKEPFPDDSFLYPSEDDSWEVSPERLTLHEVIGEGAFGVVRRGLLGGTCVAVKMLKDMPTREEIRSFRAEMELMKSVGSHPHVVSLVGCCTGRKLFIVAEYCGQGDLLTYLRRFWDFMEAKRNVKHYNNNIEVSNYRNDLFKSKTKDKDDEPLRFVVNKMYDMENMFDNELTILDLYSFCRQIAMGMEFLEANRVVHRDLAARNVLVTNDRMLKIADFGLSRDVYEDNQYKQAGSGKMPVKWMAPESLSRRIYTTKSDVWSFGVVMWEVWSVGRAPYGVLAPHRLPALLAAGHRLPCPELCPAPAYEVMAWCWQARATARPTFAALHARLDELLQSASTHQYLPLAPATAAAASAAAAAAAAATSARPCRVLALLSKTRRAFGRDTYERPFNAPVTNHYTSTPVTLSPPQII